MSREYFTITKLLESKILPIGRTKLMELIRKGDIVASYTGAEGKRGRWIISREAIDDWMEKISQK